MLKNNSKTNLVRPRLPGTAAAVGVTVSKTVSAQNVSSANSIKATTKLSSNEKNVKAIIKSDGSDKKKLKVVVPSAATKSTKPFVAQRASAVVAPKKPTQLVSNVKQIAIKKSIVVPTAAKPKLQTTVAAQPAIIKATKSNPLKAFHVMVPAKKLALLSEKNVMNTIHNVTVSSPPSQRREIVENPIPELEARERTKTRTLEPDEILVLNKVQAKEELVVPAAIVKEPVTFEINFGESLAKKQTLEPKPPPSPDKSDDEEVEYEDDFESYESDFESCSSSNKSSNRNSISAASDLLPEEEEDKEADSSDSDDSFAKHEQQALVDEEHEVSSSAKTISAASKKEDERQFDSGNYEMKVLAVEKLSHHAMNSIDEKDNLSEGQNDSGFGFNIPSLTASPLPPPQIAMDKTEPMKCANKLKIQSSVSKRGQELMRKINLDTITYSLFDLKPISYEYYMRIYGHVDAMQNSTQTNDNRIDQDCQTEQQFTKSVWTQWPPNFSGKTISSERNNLQDYRNGFGPGEENSITDNKSDQLCPLQLSLKKINQQNSIQENLHPKPVDYDRLSLFLQKSAVTISGILTDTTKTKHLTSATTSSVPQSDGYFPLDYRANEYLRHTKVYKLYSNYKLTNALYLMHQRNQTSSILEPNYLISVWSLLNPAKPMNILSSWSPINCMAIQPNEPDIVVAGLTDGSISLWNLTESNYWHPLTKNDETIFIPSQLVTPTSIASAKEGNLSFFDFGSVLSVQGFNAYDDGKFEVFDGYNPIQICSLHEYGLITIWTILKITEQFQASSLFDDSTKHQKIDHQSPWSKMKLIQSNIIDLRASFLAQTISIRRPKSGFEKTRQYFQSNLFSDKVLRELQNTNNKEVEVANGKDGSFMDFRCIDFVVNEQGMFIATNRQFLIYCTKSLNADKLRRIFIDETNFLHSTHLKSMPIDDKCLLVGMSDGSLKTLLATSSTTAVRSNNYVARKSPPTTIDETFNAKSCAVQNIIKDERKISTDTDLDPKTNSHTDDSDPDINKSHLSNDQLLLHGLSLNGHNVRSIEFSKNSNNCIALCGQRLRFFDMTKLSESESGEANVVDISLALGQFQTEYLVILLENDEIQVHIIKGKQ